MKKVLQLVVVCSAILVLNLVTLLVLAGLTGVPIGVAVGPDTCGDVNGDGDVQLADAVYLLNYLFQGGPDLACAQSASSGAVLGTGHVNFGGAPAQVRFVSLIGDEADPNPEFGSTVLPRGGVLRNLTVYGLSNTVATTVTITLIVNGQPTALTTPNPPAGTTVVVPGEVNVDAGDFVTLRFEYPAGLNEFESMQASICFD